MKKIIIFTSGGGGGHTAATNALKQYLGDTYSIQEAYIFRDVLSSLDCFKIITCGIWSNEDVYNFLLQRKMIWCTAKLYSFGNWYINTLCKKKIISILTTYLSCEKPDFIISVIPLINRPILDVAQNLSIPFLIIPTDFDTSGYIIDIYDPTYQNFFITTSFNEPMIVDPLHAALIPPKNIIDTGFLLRQDFFTPKNKLTIKTDYKIPQGKPIVTILMGSCGNNTFMAFIQQLATISIPFHIIALIGNNKKEGYRLKQIILPDHISLSIIGFIPHIADLLFITDLLITKTGPNSTCESLYSDTPCLLDITSSILPWESCVVSFVQKNQYGATIATYDAIAPLVTKLLTDSTKLITYKNNIKTMEKKEAGQEIKKLIKKIIGT